MMCSFGCRCPSWPLVRTAGPLRMRFIPCMRLLTPGWPPWLERWVAAASADGTVDVSRFPNGGGFIPGRERSPAVFAEGSLLTWSIVVLVRRFQRRGQPPSRPCASAAGERVAFERAESAGALQDAFPDCGRDGDAAAVDIAGR